MAIDNKTLKPFQLSGSIALYRNSPHQVRGAIESFFAGAPSALLTIVDNSPNDTLRSVVEPLGARYVFTGRNLGFGGGHNLAVQRHPQTSKYHLFLNPDVTFGPETLPALYCFMDHNPTVGLAMPKVFYPDMTEQKLCKLLPTPADLFLRRFAAGLGNKHLPSRMARYLLQDIDLTRPHFVPNLSGCFMFVRTEALRTSGLFDNRYFLYLEDVDLCRRIAERWDTVFYPGATIVHEYGNKSYRDLRHLQLHAASAIRYFNKWGWLHDPIRVRLNARTFDRSLSYLDCPQG
ncbi:MAG: glycosyltransferase family 2 protein [Acidobacteriaceae bacterium]